ncbi:MAG: HU family DNA-binding protein [Desulfuromonadaceae bacterium]
MTKVDIAERIQTNTGFSKKDSLELLELVLSLLKETLEAGEKIKIAGFGNFEVKHKKARRGRNPSTGESLTLEARKIMGFKASTVLKSAINK